MASKPWTVDVWCSDFECNPYGAYAELERLRTRVAMLSLTLAHAAKALDTWEIFADPFECSEGALRTAMDRIREAGGIIPYIARARQEISEALAWEKR